VWLWKQDQEQTLSRAPIFAITVAAALTTPYRREVVAQRRGATPTFGRRHQGQPVHAAPSIELNLWEATHPRCNPHLRPVSKGGDANADQPPRRVSQAILHFFIVGIESRGTVGGALRRNAVSFARCAHVVISFSPVRAKSPKILKTSLKRLLRTPVNESFRRWRTPPPSCCWIGTIDEAL